MCRRDRGATVYGSDNVTNLDRGEKITIEAVSYTHLSHSMLSYYLIEIVIYQCTIDNIFSPVQHF